MSKSNSKKPLFSVIIPYYNLGKYINEAIKSVINQTYKNWELLIIDDGSTDQFSQKIIEKYKNFSDKRIKLYQNKNQGLPKTRNFGIEKAQGKYICCLDADDKLDKTYIEKVINQFSLNKNQNIGIVTSFFQRFGKENNCMKVPDFDPIHLLLQNPLHVASAFPKSIWKEVKGYPNKPRGYEDWGFWVSIIAKGYKWITIHENLFYYRIRENSMLSGSRTRHKPLMKQIINNNRNFYEKNIIKIIFKLKEKISTNLNYINQLKASNNYFKKQYSNAKLTINKLNEHIEYQNNYINEKNQEISVYKTYDPKYKKFIKLLFNFFSLLIPYFIKKRIIIFKKIITQKRIYRKNILWNPKFSLVSILIDVNNKNYDKNLKNILENLYKQTWKDFKIYIIANHNQHKKIQTISKSYNQLHISLISQKEKKFIQKLNSKYSIIFDTNSQIKTIPTFLEKQIIKSEIDGADIVSSKIAKQSINQLQAIHIPEYIDKELNFLQKNALFKTKFLKNYNNDFFLNPIKYFLKLISKGAIIRFINEEIVYNDHDIKNINDFNISNKIKKNIKKNSDIEIINKNELINLLNKNIYQKSQLPRLMVTMAYFTKGGAPFLIYSICKHIINSNHEILINTLKLQDPSQGDTSEDFQALTDHIFTYENLFQDQNKIFSLVKYQIISRNIKYLYNAGNTISQSIFCKLKKEFPQLRIIDQQYNTIGHMKKHIKYIDCIDLSTTDNNTVRDYIINNTQKTKKQVKLIQSGVDIDNKFNPKKIEKINLPKKYQNFKYIISFLGRWSEEKAPDKFIKIAHLLKNKNILFIMGGDGPLRINIKKMIKDFQLENQIYCPGFIESNKYLKISDINIIPSNLDGFPVIAMESLAMATPVIASNVGGLPELIQDKKTGRIIDSNDIKGFVTATLEILENPELQKKYQKNARNYAEKHFSIKKMNENYKKAIFNSIN